MKNSYIHFLLIICLPVFGFGQGQKDSLTIDDYYIDFAVPDLSSLGMLGVENDEIVRPGNLKEFAAALSNFLDTDGSVRPALAMEWSFMRTFTKKNPVKWNKSFQPRNLALSVATTQQDSLGLRLGIGLKWVPIDRSDPLGDKDFYRKISVLVRSYFANEHYKKLNDFNSRALGVLGMTDRNTMGEDDLRLLAAIISVLFASNDSIDAYRDQVEKGVIKDIDSTLNARLIEAVDSEDLTLDPDTRELLVSYYVEIILDNYSDTYKSFGDYINAILLKQKETYKKDNWNAFAWEVSAGWVGHSQTTTYDDFNTEKFAFFTGVSLPTINGPNLKGQLIGQVKLDLDLSNDSLDYNRFSIGAKHLLGNSDNRFSTEILYSNAETTFVETDQMLPVRYLRYTVGAELKLTDGSWLELAFGGQKFFEGESESNAILANFGFKHAIRTKRRYDIK